VSDHLLFRRDSIGLSARGQGIVGGLMLADRDVGTGWSCFLPPTAIGGRFVAQLTPFDFRRLRLRLTDDAVIDAGAAASAVDQYVVGVVELGLLTTASDGNCGSDVMNRRCLASSQSGFRNRSPEPSCMDLS
jgi:hypothetical protein